MALELETIETVYSVSTVMNNYFTALVTFQLNQAKITYGL